MSDWPIPRKEMTNLQEDGLLWSFKRQVRYLIIAIIEEIEGQIILETNHNELFNHYERIEERIGGFDNMIIEKGLSSDFVKKQMSFINSELIDLLNITVKLLSHTDDRIDGDLQPHEVEDFLMKRLSQPGKNGKPILQEGQVNHLLSANFKGFELKQDRMLLAANCTANKLMEIFYDLHYEHNQNNKTDDYAILLKDNFSAFENSTIRSIKTNMAKNKSNKY